MGLTAPILIPLLAATLALLAGRRRAVASALGVGGATGQLAGACWLFAAVQREGIQVAQLGDWPAPYGITLVADSLSALMVLVTGIIGSSVALYSLVDIDRQRQRYGYFALLNLLLMGVSAAFLAGDVFNLYVWFEVLLMASFVLLALGNERIQLEGALKYVALNLVASFFFLAAAGLLYGTVGTLNMADAAAKLRQLDDSQTTAALAMLFLIAFGIKSALFPVFFWLPASYHTPPAAISAVFAGLLTKVGVYALLRIFSLLLVRDAGWLQPLLLILAGLTMVTGVLGAIVQQDVRHILSFHIISQIGYMVMGLGLLTPLGMAGAIFYIIHHILVKANLFLIAGVMERLSGQSRLDRQGGLYHNAPWLAVLFAIPALSLAGIPPLSGFVAKLILVRASLQAESYGIACTALAVGLLTLYSMAKIFREAFWKPRTADNGDAASGGDRRSPGSFTNRRLASQELAALAAPAAALATLTLAIGVGGQWLFAAAQQAAQELLNPQAYVHAVLESNR